MILSQPGDSCGLVLFGAGPSVRARRDQRKISKDIGSRFGHQLSERYSVSSQLVRCTRLFRSRICNVLYKIISKILSTRLKPTIPTIIHNNQVAFTPGRHISDHVILMREIMHTFALPSFRKPAFCQKSDLSKAFDRMS